MREPSVDSSHVISNSVRVREPFVDSSQCFCMHIIPEMQVCLVMDFLLQETAGAKLTPGMFLSYP